MGDIDFEDEEMPRDLAPATSGSTEYPCEVCGRESGPYGGRGPKPKKCPEHRRASVAKTGTGTRVGRVARADEALAARAVETLCQINGLLAFATGIVGFTDTCSSIQDAQDLFKERAYAALLTDAELCKSIVKSGAKSGKVALMLAYGFMGVSVVPTITMEFKEKRAARAEENGEGEA